MKKLFLNIILTVLIACSASAQFTKTIPEMTPPNPEAASLGSYGEVPMNMYTGTANIVVPLYTYDFDGLAVPINLSYNTSGIRTNQEATWVGLGWTLSSEPVITVQNNGLADLIHGNFGGPIKVGFPYTDVPIQDYGGGYQSWTPELFEKLEIYKSRENHFSGWDTEPDIFTINIFGETASFILTQKALNNGTIGIKMINGDNGFKVQFVENNKTFIVTNNRGFNFFFDKVEYSATAIGDYNENSYGVSSLHNYSTITSWKISKIVSPANKILNFTYSLPVSIQSQVQHYESQIQNMCGLNFQEELSYPPNGRSNIINGFSTIYLDKIEGEEISIKFNTSSRDDLYYLGDPENQTAFWGGTILATPGNYPKKLEEIIIKNKDGLSIFNYQFVYDYFNNQYIGAPHYQKNLRLKLNQIKRNSEVFQEFSYIKPNELSNKQLQMSDYWGFYNGINNTYNSFPSFRKNYYCSGVNNQIIIEGGNRLPNFNFGKNGLLETIIYPTKGYTKLKYEPHKVVVTKDNRITEHPFEEYEDFTVTSLYESLPVTSNIFNLTNDILNTPQEGFSSYDAKLKIASGFNTFDTGQQSHYKQSITDWQSVQSTAFEMINAQTNQVVKRYIFSDNPTCTDQGPFACGSLTLPTNSNTKIFPINFSGLPEGQYYFRVKALHEPGNQFNEDEGCYAHNCSEYGKQYHFSVRFEMKIPKSFMSKGYDREVGGARVASIENFDSNNQLITKKEYKYLLGNESDPDLKDKSSGVLLNKLSFVDIKRSAYYLHESDIGAGNSFKSLTAEVFTGGSLKSTSSNDIGYSRVEERNTDYSNQNYFKKEFLYHSISDKYNLLPIGNSIMMFGDYGSFSEYTIAKYPLYSYQDINGKLKYENSFDDNDVKIKEVRYDYNYNHYNAPNVTRSDIAGKGLLQTMVDQYNFIDGHYTGQVVGDVSHMQVYKILEENKLLITKTQTEYFNGLPLVSEVSYEYNGQYLPSRVSTTNSLGESLRTEYYYPPDLTSYYEQSALMNKLVGRNQIASPVITKTFENGTATAEERTHYAHFYENGNPEAGFILPQYVFAKKGEIGTTSLPEDKKITYDYYDEKGNLTEYTLENGIPVSIIWGYNKQYPIAKIEGLRNNQITSSIITTLQGLSNSGTLSTTSFDALRNFTNNANYNAIVTGYVYKPLVGVTAIVLPNGQAEHYQYDSFGRLQEVYVMEYDSVGNPTVKRVIKKLDYNFKD